MEMSAVVIGVSTGASGALSTVLSALPSGFRSPICVVAAVTPGLVDDLATRLDRECALDVRVAVDEAPLLAGEVWIAPHGRHLAIAADSMGLTVALDTAPPRHGCRPSADVLFESAARACDAAAVGVVLTGLGRDGCDGARAIRAAGGRVIAQDQDSSAAWGTPGAVVRASLATRVVALDDIAATLCEWSAIPAVR